MAQNNNQFLLKEIIHQEYGATEEFDNESTYFEFFSASQVLKDYAFSSEELVSGIVGGSNDGGCDSMFLILNNEIITPDQIPTLNCPRGSALDFVIIQSKKETGFGEDAIMKWKTVSTNLLDMSNDVEQYKDRYSEDVIEKFISFRDAITKLITLQPRVSIKYYYVTLGNENEVHSNVIAQSEELKTLVKHYYPTYLVDVFFYGADKLMELYSSEPDIDICVSLADQAITLGNPNEYVTLIKISDYYSFITTPYGDLRKSIFEANVRDYQGDNSVNSSIADALSKDDSGEDFWWLNNGITILSDSISLVTNKKITVKNPEVVNGLQTSTEIFRYFSSHPDKIHDDSRNVLVRFIVPSSDAVRDDIIFATNNQTNIPKSSLRVTDPIHLQIEMYCKSRGLYYDRRKNYYKNLRKKSSEIISVSFLAQCLISILLRKPDIARARPSTLLTEDETYNRLYTQSMDLSVYYKVGKLGKQVQNNLRKSLNMTPAERSDVMFYLLYGVVVKFLNKIDINPQDLSGLDLSGITENLINEVKDLIFGKYKELGGNGRVAKSSTFVNEIDLLLGLATIEHTETHMFE